MSEHTWIAEFHELAYEIAPEVHGALHVLLRPRLPQPRETAAYTIRGRDLDLKRHLQSIGQWTGVHCPCIVFVDPPTDRLEFLALGIHELGHCVPRFVLDDVAPTGEQYERQRRQVLAWAAADPTRTGGEPWRDHGSRFIRKIAHLWHRCLLQGIVLRLTDLQAAGAVYHLSPLRSYISALRGETFDLQRYSFAEIGAVPPPPEFSQLFADDVARWNSRKEKQTCPTK